MERLGRVLLAGKGFTAKEMKHTFPLIAREFAAIPVTRVPKVKVGVVGEIYVKYSPLGNNDLQKFLESQDCEVNFPGLMGFVQYCAFNLSLIHISEPTRRTPISYAVFCLKKKNKKTSPSPRD